MNHILTIRSGDGSITPHSATARNERRAARAVMLNKEGGVYLIHMKTRSYYKLPGGGMKEGEDSQAALHRELMEECGTDGEIIGEVGSVEEFRDQEGLHQISYCYLVRQQGGHVLPGYEQDEKEDGASLIIAADIDTAIHLVESATPPDEECRFMMRRDGALLREAQRLLRV